jgi:cytochrome c peroxidase
MKNRTWILASLMAVLVFTAASCRDEGDECDNCPNDDKITANYSPQPYEVEVPDHILPPPSPADNPLTVAGVALGRRLFYDKILSEDQSMSCATCHSQDKSFTDGLATSKGTRGLNGTRNAMALVNIAYNPRGFFWDGRAASLEQQALLPVEDHLELNVSWETVEERLRAHAEYPALFRQAFGIEYKKDITRDLAVKAIAQFERTLVSANSEFDRVVWLNQGEFSPEEEHGMELFFFELAQSLDHPGCSHCHLGPHFSDNQFRNNGIDDVADLNAFVDKGRGGVTGVYFDNGKFRTPTLRNIALTAPYMHDGRFQTLEEVLDSYSNGGHGVENEDTNIRPFSLSAEDKAALLAFLHTLTDTSFVNNPAFSSPF